MSARQAVLEALEGVFARHGAVPMDSSDIGFCPVDPPPDVAALLSTTGARLALRWASGLCAWTARDKLDILAALQCSQAVWCAVRRYELRAPFAAWLAQQAESPAHNPAIMESMRRYEVRPPQAEVDQWPTCRSVNRLKGSQRDLRSLRPQSSPYLHALLARPSCD